MGTSTPRLGRRAAAIAVALLPVLAGAVAGPARAIAADDDDDDVRINLAAPNDVICWEKPNPLDSCRVTVGLSHVVRFPVTVTLATVDGTAAAPEDYPAVAERVTVPAGELATEVALRVEDDGAREPDEWFYATISSPSAGRVGTARAMLTVRDGSPPEPG